MRSPMKTLLRGLRLSVLPVLCAGTALAGSVTHSPTRTKTFVNSNCEADQTCDLLSFSLHQYEYKVDFAGGTEQSYGTTVNFEYTTKSPGSLEDFALVNFIRGCQFDSTSRNGRVARAYAVKVESFGRMVPYRFPDWSIDSFDANPMYNNWPEEEVAAGASLHGSYRWNKVPGSFDEKTEVYFVQERPRTGRLYVSDRPGTAFVFDGGASAKNISVQFRVCIYRTRDIPRSTSPDNLAFASPIACHEWASSYVWDFEKGEMTRPKELDCGD